MPAQNQNPVTGCVSTWRGTSLTADRRHVKIREKTFSGENPFSRPHLLSQIAPSTVLHVQKVREIIFSTGDPFSLSPGPGRTPANPPNFAAYESVPQIHGQIPPSIASTTDMLNFPLSLLALFNKPNFMSFFSLFLFTTQWPP